MRLEKLTASVRQRYADNGDPGHDLLHIQRVMRNAKRLGEAVGANLDIVLPAALLHDVVNVPKNHPDRARASAQAAEASKQLLADAGYSEVEIAQIVTAIVEHSYSLGKAPSTLESQVVQDADRLDALGAIGLMRLVSCGALMRSRYYDPDEPFATQRPLDDKTNSIDHIEVKLLKLAGLMNTAEAKKEAERRTRFMHAFVEQLKSELR